MSTTGVKTSKADLSTWGHPDAPEQFDKGRVCETPLEKCETALQTGQRATLNIYAESNRGVLLCSLCDRKRIDLGKTPGEFAGIKKKEKTFALPNLKKYRNVKGLKQTELAEMAEVGPKHLGAIETGKIKASPALINRLAFVLGVRARQLRGV